MQSSTKEHSHRLVFIIGHKLPLFDSSKMFMKHFYTFYKQITSSGGRYV